MSNELHGHLLVEAIAFFLALSALLYALFAGADFGGGILEAFATKPRKREQRELISQAIGPVWEANHVWLILAIVILFVAFPREYAAVSVSFHIPLTAMLIGIIVRGCAFTFRHYDAVKGRSQRYYSQAFVVSSFLTPLTIGIVAGGTTLGRVISPTAAGFPTPTFAEAFINPWFNYFSFSVGLFTGALFAFLAAVYLLGETNTLALRSDFVKRAGYANLVAALAGALVFIAAEIDGLPLAKRFLAAPQSLLAVSAATLLLAPLWFAIRHRHDQTARVLVGAQVSAILVGWFSFQFPVLIASTRDAPITTANAAAPQATLQFLLWALIVGSLLIFPALFYLLRLFKQRPAGLL